MIRKEIVINIPNGLEARPVALLVQVASQYECSIYVESDEENKCKKYYGYDEPWSCTEQRYL